jgi:hypothetical protein
VAAPDPSLCQVGTKLAQSGFRFAAIVGRVRSAARFPPELVRLAEQLARKDLSAADIHRAVGARAGEIGVPRPSYERTRQLVYEIRLEPIEPRWGELLLDVDLRNRPPDAIIRKATDSWIMDEDAGLRRKARRPRK